MAINGGGSAYSSISIMGDDWKEDLTKKYDEAERHIPKSKSLPKEFSEGVSPERKSLGEKTAEKAAEAIPFHNEISPEHKANFEASAAKHHHEMSQRYKEDPASEPKPVAGTFGWSDRHIEMMKKHGPGKHNENSGRYEYGDSGIHVPGHHARHDSAVHKERMKSGDEAANNLSISLGKEAAKKKQENYQNMKPENRDKLARVKAYQENAPYSHLKTKKVEVGRTANPEHEDLMKHADEHVSEVYKRHGIVPPSNND